MGLPDRNDEILGALRHDPDLNWYEGRWAAATGPVLIKLQLDEDGRIEPALARARRVLPDLATFAAAAADHAVAELLELKNESWLAEGEEPVTPEEFRLRMRLSGIVFDQDGEVTFYHEDGDLFWGHSIEVAMDAEGDFHHADIPG